MIYVTAFMLFAVMALAPLRLKISSVLNLTQKTAAVKVKLYAIKFFEEAFSLTGTKLNYAGTLNGTIELTGFRVDSGGVQLFKCITVDEVCLAVNTRINGSASLYVAMLTELLAALGTFLACALSHAKIRSYTSMGLDDEKLTAELAVNTTLAEFVISLIKQSVGRKKNG